jgi:hypothetical protein
MSAEGKDAVEVLRAHWSATSQDSASVGELDAGQKVCKNMKDVTFDGFAEPGSDLGQAWRKLLAVEGKLAPPGATLRDLVLGNQTPHSVAE